MGILGRMSSLWTRAPACPLQSRLDSTWLCCLLSASSIQSWLVPRPWIIVLGRGAECCSTSSWLITDAVDFVHGAHHEFIDPVVVRHLVRAILTGRYSYVHAG